ncbi:MAG: ABC transporter ATP-binding protein [Gammaproteobacteria bacterium]
MNLLEAHRITFERGGQRVLENIDLALAEGQFLGIIGPNGAGKTSLLRILAGLEAPSGGQVLCAGEPLASMAAARRARHLGYHAQNPELHWSLRVSDILRLGRVPHQGALLRHDQADNAAIARAVAMTGLGPLLKRRGDSLSGGELARVHIARLLAGEHRVLLADEPIANLDPRFQIDVMNLLRQHAAQGGANVVVLHDLAIAARFCDALILMDQGRVHAAGTPAEVLTSTHLSTVFGVGGDYWQLSGIPAALDLREPLEAERRRARSAASRSASD